MLVVIEGDCRLKLEADGQKVVSHILEWYRGAKLEISERKTEAIVLKSDWIEGPNRKTGRSASGPKTKSDGAKKATLERRPPIIRIRNHSIRFRKEVRYLCLEN